MNVMELVGEVVVAESYRIQAGDSVDSVSVSSVPIEKLVDNLRGRDVNIDPSNSLMDVRFTVLGMRGIPQRVAATVMLGTTFPSHVDTVAYHLRDKEGLLELEISNYESRRSLGQPGDIGGTIEGEAGVICEFSLRTENGDASIVRELRAAMEETYRTGSRGEGLLDGAVREPPFMGRVKVHSGMPKEPL